MGIITVDDVKYESDNLTEAGKSILAHLVEADKKTREASMDAAIFQAAVLQLIVELKTNHLTDEAIATEEVEVTEE